MVDVELKTELKILKAFCTEEGLILEPGLVPSLQLVVK